MQHYVISAEGDLTSYPTRESAVGSRPPAGAFVVGKEADLKEMPGPLLLLVYNRIGAAQEQKVEPVKKFSDKDTAARRTWAAIEHGGTARKGEALTTTTQEEDTTVATATKKTPRKRAVKKEASAGRRGRVSEFAGLKLHAKTSENPRRPKSFGYKSLAIIINNKGVTYEEFLAKGGRRVDLAWDVAHGYVEAR